MTYAIVITLSVIVAFLGFASEVTNGNICHVQNGREPNAGAAIFPNIPFIPIVAVAFVWLVNRIHPYLGFWGFLLLFCLYMPYWWVDIRRSNAKLRSMMESKGVQAEPNDTIDG